jgi:hypothetical protein
LADGGAKCNPTDFKAAQDAFANKLQIDPTKDWTKPLDLLQALHDIYGDDAKLGLVKVCK